MALLSAASLAGPPFRTDDPEPVDSGHWEMTLFSQGTVVRDGTAAILPAYEVNYGALPNLQLHAIFPLDYESQTGHRAASGLGNIELGAKYRFITPGEDDWFPQVGVFPTVEVPTGNPKLGFGTGHPQVFLPLWVQKDFDPWSAYGGGGYWFNPGFGNRDYWFIGAALWRDLSESFHVGIEVFHQAPDETTDRASTGFNVGSIYDFTHDWHLLNSVGTGLQNRGTTNQFSYYLGLQLTF